MLIATSSRADSRGAKALESRLYAPCCYGGTLDIHDSELARALREEIEARVTRGETSDAVQDDLVARYGDRILAARSDAPIRHMGTVLGAGLALSAVALAVLARRLTRPTRRPQIIVRGRDSLDERLDAELANLD